LASLSPPSLGVSIGVILWSAIRSIVWEFLNSNRDLRELVKPLISPLTALNTEYYLRKEENDQLLKSSEHISSARPPISIEEQQLEREIILSTYVPSQIISTCLRNICTNPDIERKLINQLDRFFHLILNKNIRLTSEVSRASDQGLGTGTGAAGILKMKYERLMRPTHLTDVKIQDLFDFFESDTSAGEGGHDCAHLLVLEQRKLSKKLNKYLYKTRETERL
jgi:hypothetical protein